MPKTHPKFNTDRHLLAMLDGLSDATVAGRLLTGNQAAPLQLRDSSAQLPFHPPPGCDLKPGDIVSAVGQRIDDHFHAQRVTLLVRPPRPLPIPEPLPHVHRRAQMNHTLRTWFSNHDFIEVETPNLVLSPGTDVYLEAFSTQFTGLGPVAARHLFLHTSPEFAMKRLLVSGHERIAQICKVYRNGEWTATHNPEFTMAEWYRAFTDYTAVMADVEAIVRAVLGPAPRMVRGQEVHLDRPFEVMTVTEAFHRFCRGLDLWAADTAEALREASEQRGLGPLAPGGSWDDLFHELLVTWVEPQLGAPTPLFLVDYPAPLAVLSRRRDDDPRVAERFELYIAGVELCNGFTELNDPAEQRERFTEDLERRGALGLPTYPMPERFLRALEGGMPPSSGVALGLDRLLMIALGTEHLNDVLIRALHA